MHLFISNLVSQNDDILKISSNVLEITVSINTYKIKGFKVFLDMVSNTLMYITERFDTITKHSLIHKIFLFNIFSYKKYLIKILCSLSLFIIFYFFTIVFFYSLLLLFRLDKRRKPRLHYFYLCLIQRFYLFTTFNNLLLPIKKNGEYLIYYSFLLFCFYLLLSDILFKRKYGN